MPLIYGGRYWEGDPGCDVRWYTFTPNAASSTAIISTPVVLATGATTTVTDVTAGVVQPDVPRNLRVVGNQASVTGNVVVTGFDVENKVITETLALNGVTVVNGLKAFRYITQIVFPARAAANDSVTVGVGATFGFPEGLRINTVFKTFLNNVLETTAPTVTTDANLTTSNCTFTLNSAIPGAQVVDILYVIK